MKVIINTPKNEQPEPTNLPAHDEALDLIRASLARKNAAAQASGSEMLGASRSVQADTPNAVDDGVEMNEAWSEELPPSDTSIGEPDSWKTSRWVPLVLLGAVLAFAGIWYLATQHSDQLRLARVTVEGATMLTTQEVLQLAKVDSSEKFYDIDLKAIQDRLLAHSLIKSAHPRRELNPPTIVLHIEERQPVALVRSQSTGEAYIVDQDGVILRPKLMTGLRNRKQLLDVPLITGIADNDTASFRAMARMVTMMQTIDSGALRGAIGELARTPTGGFIIYTTLTQTPIFIGSPTDQPFLTALEEEHATNTPRHAEPLFTQQLQLLAHLWKGKIEPELLSGHDFYVDARFKGEIIVKRRPGFAKRPVNPASSSISS